jgi:glycosyltransferase involved in cell wall biosynthesis
MKILLSSLPFAPKVGGMETIALLLAQEWSAMGHTVTVVTETAEEAAEGFPFAVVRCPDFRTLRRLIKAHDVYLQNNVSVRLLWAWIGTRKPLFIAHHTQLFSESRADALRLVLKRFFMRRATNICVSRAIAASIAPQSHIIGNAYDDKLFHLRPEIERNRDLIFVGRLVRTKGVDVLLRALKILQLRGLTPHLKIVGSGPCEASLRALCEKLDLSAQVEFAGTLRGEALASCMASHRLLVAPSTWQEPFGIVALEGIACGCAVVGSSGGGLSDAIGLCGETFRNGDSEDLARVMTPLLENPSSLRPYLEAAPAHLEKHSARGVATAYLRVFER